MCGAKPQITHYTEWGIEVSPYCSTNQNLFIPYQVVDHRVQAIYTR